MSVSPAVLLVTLAVGVPLMLLALGVLYHAYLLSRQPQDFLESHVDALATESAEELLIALQETVDEMQAQLASQRDALAGMLSDAPPVFATALASASSFDRPMAAGDYVEQSAEMAARTPPTAHAMPSVRSRIAELADGGLSDRAIARELHIGLEEVRIARLRGRDS
jgi:DNA-binding NarL/FixJ family response regulator